MTAIDRFLATDDPGNVDELRAEIVRLQRRAALLEAAAQQAQHALRSHPTVPSVAIAMVDMILFAVLPEPAP